MPKPLIWRIKEISEENVGNVYKHARAAKLTSNRRGLTNYDHSNRQSEISFRIPVGIPYTGRRSAKSSGYHNRIFFSKYKSPVMSGLLFERSLATNVGTGPANLIWQLPYWGTPNNP
jgi:hypothetical protein